MSATSAATSAAAAAVPSPSSSAAEKAPQSSPAAVVPLVGYEERHTWPLTSGTSCYSSSGGECGRGNGAGCRCCYSFATERHVVRLNLGHSDGDIGDCREDNQLLTQRSVFERQKKNNASRRRSREEKANMSCVGYTRLGEWEALVLLQQQRSPPTQQQSTTTAIVEGGAADSTIGGASITTSVTATTAASGSDTVTTAPPTSDDNASVSSVNTEQQQQRPFLERSASSQLSVGSAPAMEDGIDAMGDGVGGRGAHRSSSTGDLPVFSRTAATSTNSGNNNNAAQQQNQPSQQNQQPRAKLILRRWRASGAKVQDAQNEDAGVVVPSEEEQVDIDGPVLAEEYEVGLDFRPLAPTLCRLSTSSPETIGDVDTTPIRAVGVWIGSSDHCKLQLWVPTTSSAPPATGTLPTLQQVELNDPAFEFVSSIMAIDCSCHCCDSDNVWSHTRNQAENHVLTALHCLAVLCQDGTIRLINFNWKQSKGADSSLILCTPEHVTETTVIVDGPLTCVSLERCHRTSNNSLYAMHAVVGSLCGYVCELWLPASSPPRASGSQGESQEENSAIRSAAFVNSNYWDGPAMVAEGFWNSWLETEDSVLAVASYHGDDGDGCRCCWVAVGTHSGRCMIYEKPSGDGNYELHWSCQLPYSVHGISFVNGSMRRNTKTNSENAAFPLLVVTTRGSVSFDHISGSSVLCAVPGLFLISHHHPFRLSMRTGARLRRPRDRVRSGSGKVASRADARGTKRCIARCCHERSSCCCVNSNA